MSWIPCSIKDHILETQGNPTWNARRGEKEFIFSGFLRQGFLCQISFDGGRTKLIDVSRRRYLRSENDPDEKELFSGSISFQNSLRPCSMFKGKAEWSGELSESLLLLGWEGRLWWSSHRTVLSPWFHLPFVMALGTDALIRFSPGELQPHPSNFMFMKHSWLGPSTTPCPTPDPAPSPKLS